MSSFTGEEHARSMPVTIKLTRMFADSMNPFDANRRAIQLLLKSYGSGLRSTEYAEKNCSNEAYRWNYNADGSRHFQDIPHQWTTRRHSDEIYFVSIPCNVWNISHKLVIVIPKYLLCRHKLALHPRTLDLTSDMLCAETAKRVSLTSLKAAKWHPFGENCEDWALSYCSTDTAGFGYKLALAWL